MNDGRYTINMETTNCNKEIATDADNYSPRNGESTEAPEYGRGQRNGGRRRKEPPTDPAFDELLDLVSNQRRRDAVDAVAAHGPVDLSTVVDYVAEREYGTPAAQLGYDDRKRVRIALYQTHLKKLDEAGIVEYDKSRGEIEPGEHLDRAVRVLRAAEVAFETERTPTISERLAGVFS